MSVSGSYRPVPPRQERATATTDGTGTVVFNWPAGAFTAPPVVGLAVQAGAGFRSARVVANTAAATTVSVLQSTSVTLLGIGVLAAGGAAPGVTVHATATAV
ncbi:hypothetical protein [Streptomyces europaeiscabiei]|uniref:hypothetical protein n=1 Tax=Streptomyces europaeiscabiei TaxID=146819 RepID=UPI002E0D3EA2|nr:hypothetical protein OHB30_33435 [Streptomyces europaeiscabiei]